MNRKIRCYFWIVCLLCGLLASGIIAVEAAPSQRVAIVKIEGAINPGTISYARHAFDMARENDAPAVILELDTPGGYINSAEEIRRVMDEFNRPIHAFVRPNAISAGAYLALAADSIYMVPGATIGAAEPSYLGLGEVDEKSLSYWEKEMVAMAERQGRDPGIASAMVRRDRVVEGLSEEGDLLTLTAGEALAVGYSEGTVENYDALLAEAGLPETAWTVVEKRAVDSVVGWTTNPVVGTILLMIGLGGLIVEIISAGFGIAGIVSIVAFALYFGGNIAAGMADYWVLILFVFGIVMLLVEAFMPGFGVFGIGGIVTMVVAIVLAAVSIQTGLVMLIVSFVLAGLFAVLAFRFFARRGALRHIILSDEEKADLGYVAPPDQKSLLGLEGVTITALRPSGAALLDNRRIDVVSDGSYIPANEPVVVQRVEGVRVIVQALKKNEKED